MSYGNFILREKMGAYGVQMADCRGHYCITSGVRIVGEEREANGLAFELDLMKKLWMMTPEERWEYLRSLGCRVCSVDEVAKLYRPEMTKKEWTEIVMREMDERGIYDPDGYLMMHVFFRPLVNLKKGRRRRSTK